jgi:hypothetical protein
VQDARASGDGERRAVAAGLERLAPGLDADELDALVATKGAKMPIAFEPPPTHAMTRSGRRPSCSRTCARASSPMTRCRSRTIAGYGAGPTAEPMM